MRKPVAGEAQENLRLPTSLPEDYVPTPESGLTDAQAEDLRRAGQGNRATSHPGKSALRVIVEHVFTLFNLLNIALAALLFWVGAQRNALFLGVVVSNTLIGIIQELRARYTVARLRLLTLAPIQATRGGKTRPIPVEDAVRGDLITLRAGEQVPADATVRFGSCTVSEAMLTGESGNVEKKPGSWLYSGSYITSGRCVCQLVHVGDASYINRLSRAAKKLQPPVSEMAQSLQRLVRMISAALVPVGILLFLSHYYLEKLPLESAIPRTVAAVVGMIPEGLMLLTSVALTVGVLRLARQRTLVQEMNAIESLAMSDVVCLDKTGTLTTGRMTLHDLKPIDVDLDTFKTALARYLGASDRSSPTLSAIAQSIRPGVEAASMILPFSSERKKSAVSFRDGTTLVLGAPSYVLGLRETEEIHELIAEQTAQGMRVVCLAECAGFIRQNDTPPVRRVLGLCMIADEVRPEAPETLRFFREEGVQIKLISGDDPDTVTQIAHKAGLGDGETRAVDLSTVADQMLGDAVEKYDIFGRATPEQKQRLVLELQKRGHKVVMTGDGVNDIPAMKLSDCSVAMASGADAARHAAHIVLLDDDFSALPHVVAEGRRVVHNITRTASLFLVKTIYSFALSVLMLFIPGSYPFLPIQLTLISSLTVGIPSFFLALEPNREPVRGAFLRKVLIRALPGGTAVTLCAIASALMESAWPAEVCSTLATIAAGWVGLVMLHSVCAPLNRFRFILLAVMTGLFVCAVGFAGPVFYLVPLSGAMWAVLIGEIAFSVLVILLLRRFLPRILPEEVAR